MTKKLQRLLIFEAFTKHYLLMSYTSKFKRYTGSKVGAGIRKALSKTTGICCI
jgi:hypothetical protein